MNKNKIYNYIDNNLDAHIQNIQHWVKQKSVSWDNLGMNDASKIVFESYKKLGCKEVEYINGQYYPGIYAYYDAGSKYTLHNYCMYDTRTVEKPEQWDFDPWGGELLEYDGHDEVIGGRGSMGAKGPYVAWLNALESIIAIEGTLPFNIVFIAEGEEIMGSPSYKNFVNKYKNKLKNVNASFCPTSTQNINGDVTIGMGLKGMIVLDLTVRGSKYNNGPHNTIHSSSASLVDCPPFRLIQALSTMTNKKGNGCNINGMEKIWNERKVLDKDEERLLNELVERYEDKDWRDVLPLGGINNFDIELKGEKPLKEFLYGPTLNISGLRSGFLGKETGLIPFIIPSEATASIDMRIVTKVSSDEIIDLLRKHLDYFGFTDVEIKIYSSFDYCHTSSNDPVVNTIENTLNKWNINCVKWPMQAGGGPWSVVPNVFNVPCYRGGVIGGGNRGNVNEYMIIKSESKIANLDETEKYIVDLIYDVKNSLDNN